MEYTVKQIAELGFEKFEIKHGSVESCCKKIRKVLNENNVQKVGEGKSTTTARNKAALYPEKVNEKILNETLFEYFKNALNQEAVTKMKSNEQYQAEADKVNEEYDSKVEQFLQSGDTDWHEHAEIDYSQLTRHSTEIRQRKFEIMLEALFSQQFSLDLTSLIDDMNKANFISDQHQSSYEAEDMRLFEKVSDWENYVSKNKQE